MAAGSGAPDDPRTSRALPLRYRLPNPPPLFVGRDAELNALNTALGRFPVAVLCGPGGLGKTALALQGLAAQPGFEPERALLIELRSGEPAEDPRVQVIGALARAQGLERGSWANIGDDKDAIGGALVDLAESGGWWILLDDLHQSPVAAADRLLALLARYSRKSRWIVTTRSTPQQPELSHQIIHVGGLDEGALRVLAAGYAPGLTEAQLQHAIDASGGSPWMLQQVLMSPEGGEGEDRLLGGLPAGGRQFLEALVTVDRALPLDALRTFTPLPVLDVVQAMVKRGLIQRTYDGYRLHDVVRRILVSAAAPGRVGLSPVDAGRPLACHADPEATLEGARLLLCSGAIDEVIQTLERFGTQLIDQGHAPRLWQLLQLCDDVRLNRWRLCCAVSLAQPALLMRLPAPAAADPVPVRLLWARGLLIQGKYEAVLGLTRALRAQAAADTNAGLAGEAGLVEVEALVEQGGEEEAINVITGLPPAPDGDERAIRESWLVLCLAFLGRQDEAGQRLAPLWAGRSEHPSRVTWQLTLNLARALRLLDRYREGFDASQAVLSMSIPNERMLRTHFISAISAGHFQEAGQVLGRMEPFSPARSPIRALHSACTILYRLAVGALQGIDHLISSVKQELIAAGDVVRLEVVLQWERGLRITRGEPLTPLAGEDHVGRPTFWTQFSAEAWRMRAEGLPPRRLAEMHDSCSAAGSHQLLLEELEFTAQFLSGDVSTAIRRCADAVQNAEEMGYRHRELLLRQTHCDMVLVGGDATALKQAVEGFYALATACHSPGFQEDARFFAALLPPNNVDWVQLDRLAERGDAAPIASRRARALLGEQAPLDAIDRRVLAALRERRGVVPARSLERSAREHSSGMSPVWGLADEGCRVWLRGGACPSFTDRPQLWSILVCLFDHGGEASKEQLVQEVWALVDYHPLRHDNRLHVAIHKLRVLIEEDPKQPRRLVTTADGYALRGTVRRAPLG